MTLWCLKDWKNIFKSHLTHKFHLIVIMNEVTKHLEKPCDFKNAKKIPNHIKGHYVNIYWSVVHVIKLVEGLTQKNVNIKLEIYSKNYPTDEHVSGRKDRKTVR